LRAAGGMIADADAEGNIEIRLESVRGFCYVESDIFGISGGKIMMIQKRAEIALRSLEDGEQKRLLSAIEKLDGLDVDILKTKGKIRKFPSPDEPLYIYRGTQRLRILLSRQKNIWIVEDIVAHDRLKRIISEKNQQ